MIEIIGAEKKGEKEWRSLPKNVRQIGGCQEKWKIYMEDYVITYLNKIARPDQAYARGAILFGNVYDTEEGTTIFISGALEAGNLEFDLSETIFNERIWYELMEKGEKYFPGQEVMGWFLSRMGFSVEINQKILTTHMRNFSGDHNVLYMIDSLEKEDAMYLYENQQMKRQKGYYIYYEKNSAMQEYMLSNNGGKKKITEEQNAKTELRRDKKIVNSYRRMNRYRKESRNQDVRIKAIRAACAALIFVMGLFIASKLGSRFAGAGFENYAFTTFQAVKSVFMPLKSDVAEEDIRQGEVWLGEDSQQKEGFGDNIDEQDGEKLNEIGQESELNTVNRDDSLDGKTETIKETVTVPKPIYYIVKRGDTLAEISRKMYSTDKYTAQLAEANNLANANEIYEGQRLVIPSVE